MANCVSCSAPLLGSSTICEYCGRRNDTNLHGIHKYTVTRPESERICPRCDIPLQTINLKKGEKFYIERCGQCMGLFFDHNELEALLELSVSNVFRIDRKRLDTITIELYQRDVNKAQYIKCPVCREFMGRRNFGAKSGVIVDRCSTHGVWLDGGELKRILEWKKAGGQLLHETIKQKEKKSIPGKSANRTSSDALADALMNKERLHSKTRQIHREYGSGSYGRYDNDDIVSSVFRLIEKLF
jgi:Zn-finger nucleic acid-binding protein